MTGQHMQLTCVGRGWWGGDCSIPRQLLWWSHLLLGPVIWGTGGCGSTLDCTVLVGITVTRHLSLQAVCSCPSSSCSDCDALLTLFFCNCFVPTEFFLLGMVNKLRYTVKVHVPYYLLKDNRRSQSMATMYTSMTVNFAINYKLK